MPRKLGRPDLSAYTHRFDVPEAKGALGVTFLGVSTLLIDDGESTVLVDGFFSRPPLLRVVLGKLSPDAGRISAALAGLGFGEGGRALGAVVAVHTHFDHAMDAGEVARRTGAVLYGGRSTVMVGRGAGAPEDRMQVVASGDSVTVGSFTLHFVESEHCPPDRFPGTVTEPLVPPARAASYKCGEAWSILVKHQDSGRSALVQGSAGFRPDALSAWETDVVYLGIGQLGVQEESYIRDYWRHTVTAVGARRVVATHWDDFFRPLDKPLRALPYLGDDLDTTMRILDDLAGDDGVLLHLPTPWRREDPWAGLG